MASPSWSPDGQWIAFLGKEGKDAERYNTWNVYVMEARTGRMPRQITHYDGVHASASRAQPEWSPDGKRLVYLESTGAKNSAYNMSRLAVITVDGGAPKLLADKLDRAVSSPRFTPDGASILFLVSDDRSEYPARIPANGGAVERLVQGPGMISTLAQGKDGRLAVLAATDRTHPEIHALENGSSSPADASKRCVDGGTQAGRHGGFQLQSEGWNGSTWADHQAARSTSRAANIRRCCASTAAPTGRIRTLSISSARSSPPMATWW